MGGGGRGDRGSVDYRHMGSSCAAKGYRGRSGKACSGDGYEVPAIGPAVGKRLVTVGGGIYVAIAVANASARLYPNVVSFPGVPRSTADV